MTRIALLERLRDFTLDATKNIVMPTQPQKSDNASILRAADVHLMRLPDENVNKKVTPYIIHQFVNGLDVQEPGQLATAAATVRSIFAVYNDNSSEGALMLLNLMESLRIELLRKVIIGGQFILSLDEGLESFIYPDDTAPFFAGEMISVWKLPAVERELPLDNTRRFV